MATEEQEPIEKLLSDPWTDDADGRHTDKRELSASSSAHQKDVGKDNNHCQILQVDASAESCSQDAIDNLTLGFVKLTSSGGDVSPKNEVKDDVVDGFAKCDDDGVELDLSLQIESKGNESANEHKQNHQQTKENEPNNSGLGENGEASMNPNVPLNRDAEEQEVQENEVKDPDDEGVDCGFLVDRINCIPYQKAMQRGEVPFCAFAPISTEDLYLLKIQDCSDTTRHMLVPATKEEVFNAQKVPEAVDRNDEQGDEALKYRVPIVAIARQIYSEEDRQLVVSVDQLLRKDKKKISTVKFLTVDKFADFAFLGFDGNISEYAAKSETDNRHPSLQQQSKLKENEISSPPLLQSKIKTPPKMPSRRGRGGRRKTSRKSPLAPQSHTGFCHIIQLHPVGLPSAQGQLYPGTFQSLSAGPGSFIATDGSSEPFAFTGVNQCSNQNHQFVTQIPSFPQFQHPIGSNQASYFHIPTIKQDDVNVPINVNVGLTESSSEPKAQVNHDIMTIAFDQLATIGDPFGNPCNVQTYNRGNGSSGRGGRRPGRKPGGKRASKDKTDEESIAGSKLLDNNEIIISLPKRRGRPPKNRSIIPISGQENDNTITNAEELERFEKRVKLNIF